MTIEATTKNYSWPQHLVPFVFVMSEDEVNPVSPNPSVSSISLVEIKEETRLVLKAFLRNSLSESERPGTIGGLYKDPNKYRANVKKQQNNGWDSLDEEINSVEEKKHGFKDQIKRRLKPRPTTLSIPDQTWKSSYLEKGSRPKGEDAIKIDHFRTFCSSSEDEGSEEKKKKKPKKKNNLQNQLTALFSIKKKLKEKETRPQLPVVRAKAISPTSFFKRPAALTIDVAPKKPEKDKGDKETRSKKPATLNIDADLAPVASVASPTHPPEFYQEVAGTLEKIAHRSRSIKGPKKPSPRPSPDTTPVKSHSNLDKEEMVRQLVQVLSMEGDVMNSKIESDPFLRSTLTRLSYPSFAKLLDTFASQEQATPSPLPTPASSPTLRRVAVTMEVSRRVVTATGAQRMQGYTERYMENFAPWVKSQGGWESIVQLEELLEYD
ncbi:hypothetical protein UPYG_G00111460 [Umbra pygmaea]|uniref:Bcl-2-like protein 12 n=1 Tax=Umbra pygmaea TaxID=75934 RepID=A0ABD0X329_UMBPY